MKKIERKLELKKRIRVIGFDDSPFSKERGSLVNLSGIICSNTRFEGMLWGDITKDGSDATEKIAKMLCESKFYQQIDLVLLDGIAVGGFNIIRLVELSQLLKLPCVAVMRRVPDLESIRNALENFEDSEKRFKDIQQAGEIYEVDEFVFQTIGCDKHTVAKALRQVTDIGNVPEALRLAHLIGAAVKTGESSSRA